MIKKEIKELTKILIIFSEEFDGGKPISELKAETWFNALSQYSISDLQKAASKVLRNRIYSGFPKIAEIVESIEGSKQDKAQTAWQQVKKAMSDYGYIASVKFSNVVIHSVIEDMGGWVELCKRDDPFIEKNFIEKYLFHCQQANHPKYIAGLLEIENRMNGYLTTIKEPYLIGFNDDIRKIKN